MVNTAVHIETVVIPAGPFDMGSEDGLPNEQPVHRVDVRAFALAVTPVTNAQYAVFLNDSGREPPRFWRDERFNAPGQPVVAVAWFDAVAFCDWLSVRSGERWRLPTEAEREKAARGGIDGQRYPWGDDAGEDGGRFPQDAPREAGLSAPNGYGLLDIAYNVHEWCSDWYDAEYYARSPSRDPQGPPEGTRRASRGGAWRHQVKVCRNAARSSLDPSFQYNDYGFRPARNIG